jgi:hypothetical protein
VSERDDQERVFLQVLEGLERLLMGVHDRAVLELIQDGLKRFQKIVRRKLGPVQPGCVRFELLPFGAFFPVGANFAEGPVRIRVQDFQWSNGIWTNLGFSEVENGGLAGGAGQEMEVNNVNLAFDFGGQLSKLTVNVGEYGGNLNLEVNGALWNFDNFSALPGPSLGGVNVQATMIPIPLPARGETGSLELSGSIDAFVIGGQELWIDDVCFQ